MKLQGITRATRSTSSLNKKKYIIIGIVVVIIMILLFLMFASGGQKTEDSKQLSQVFEQNVSIAVAPPPPPPLEFDVTKVQELTKEAQSQEPTPALDINNVLMDTNTTQAVTNDKELNALVNRLDETDGKNPDGSKQTIRPEDMIAYLKAKQNNFSFNKGKMVFDFENKTYKKGQSFKGWWYVEDITPVFIRFVDEQSDYAYNLRFLEERKQ